MEKLPLLSVRTPCLSPYAIVALIIPSPVSMSLIVPRKFSDKQLPAGYYVYELQAGEKVLRKKMLKAGR